MKPTFITLIIFLVIPLLGGCASNSKPVVMKQPLPEAYSPLQSSFLPIINSEDVKNPYSADLRLTIDQKGLPTIRLKGFILVKDPGFLRLEIDGAVGSGTALACNGQRMTVINSHDRTYEEAPANNLSQSGLLPIPLSCADLTAIIQGFLPSAGNNFNLFYDTYLSRITATFSYKGYYWRALFAPTEQMPALLEKIELRKNRRSDPILSIELGNYSTNELGRLPGNVNIKSWPQKLEVIFKLDDYDSSNPGDDLFYLKKPRGY